jgi:CBS domain-containing protein
MDIYYVAGMFLGTGFRRFAVVEDDRRLIGVITRTDILRGVAKKLVRP